MLTRILYQSINKKIIIIVINSIIIVIITMILSCAGVLYRVWQQLLCV